MTDTMNPPAAADERAALEQRLIEASAVGMTTAVWASVKPDAIAVYDSHGAHTLAKINANANKVARFLRANGLLPGDPVALLCSNRAEFVEVLQGCLRCGVRLTPVNWHLTADEIAYVVNDCRAKVLFAETRYEGGLKASAGAPRLVAKAAIGGDAEGFLSYADDVLGAYDGSDIDDPVPGNTMLYTSGTTGRPKGVYRKRLNQIPFVLGGARGYDHERDVQLCVGPAYHAAPLGIDVRGPMSQGVPIVFMDGRWDSEAVLRTIEQYRVTHGHMVAIMFQRLLSLPPEVRAKYDLSSLRAIIHGAAPTPPDVKRGMIEWLGPILSEYYAGSEGGGGFHISSEEWLRKPGSVGRPENPENTRVLDEEGNPVAPGEPGMLYFKAAANNPFEYFNDPEKTAASHRDGYFTLGDVGYFDEDGYLFLTGRTAECIISGGVNIYPQEIDNELIKHPAVEDSCTIGVPNGEWGEEVKSVVTLNPGFQGSPELAKDIQTFARDRLAGFKVPRSIEFVDELPRSPAGKIQRKKVREPYWAGRARSI
ncbi:MAG TPA: AMP-binding protein [Caulobacteraceae bacterium]|nr:AMP-binding protein [Caulobacteraceae bacterium]